MNNDYSKTWDSADTLLLTAVATGDGLTKRAGYGSLLLFAS
jgi:hypothetical protein